MNIQELVQNQRDFYNRGYTKDLDYRIKKLRELKEAVEINENRIMEALDKDLGKSPFESYETEIGMFYQEINHIIKNLKKWGKPKRVKTPLAHFPSKSIVYSEPYGQVLVISPWNYPFQLTLHPFIAAIAAGNTVIIKPSEISEHSAKVLRKIIEDTFDKEYAAVVEGGKERTQELLDQHFDYVFFTGSTAVGKIVYEKAAEKLIPVTLELGGKSPCIVDKTADIKLSAKRIAWGKLLNAGQTCVAPDYICLQKEVKEEFIKYLIESIEEFYGKDPLNNKEYPKIINEKHFQRLVEYLKKDIVFYGGGFDRQKEKIAPAIIEGTWESASMKEEIFGPLLPIIEFDQIEEIVNVLRNKAKPLALYLFTTSKENEERILRDLSFGGGAVNDVVIQVSSSYLPFGGVGKSGLGSYHGKEGFETFTHKKSILKKSNLLDIPLRYPPFKNNLKLLRKILK